MGKKVIKADESKASELPKKIEPPKVVVPKIEPPKVVVPPPVVVPPKVVVSPPIPAHSLGEVFANPYLGCKFTEVLTANKERAGWIWTHTDGRVVVMLGMGFHLWYNEGGEDWTVETGCLWLVTQKGRF